MTHTGDDPHTTSDRGAVAGEGVRPRNSPYTDHFLLLVKASAYGVRYDEIGLEAVALQRLHHVVGKEAGVARRSSVAVGEQDDVVGDANVAAELVAGQREDHGVVSIVEHLNRAKTILNELFCTVVSVKNIASWPSWNA